MVRIGRVVPCIATRGTCWGVTSMIWINRSSHSHYQQDSALISLQMPRKRKVLQIQLRPLLLSATLPHAKILSTSGRWDKIMIWPRQRKRSNTSAAVLKAPTHRSARAQRLLRRQIWHLSTIMRWMSMCEPMMQTKCHSRRHRIRRLVEMTMASSMYLPTIMTMMR